MNDVRLKPREGLQVNCWADDALFDATAVRKVAKTSLKTNHMNQ